MLSWVEHEKSFITSGPGLSTYRIYPEYWDTLSPCFISPSLTTLFHNLSMCLKLAGWVTNKVDPDQTPDLHYLLRPICPNT